MKAVIFDVDGTLLNTESVYMLAWVKAAKEFGYDMPDIALRKTRAVNAAVAAACFREYCGQDFPYETVRDRRIQIAEAIIDATEGEKLHMPGAKMILDWLKAQGYAIAAASSTGYGKTVSHLDHAGLLDRFDRIVGGDMVEKGKPNPDIFLKAAQLLGADPASCIVVGDSPADVFAASSAGMKMVLIPDQVPANPETTAASWKILGCLEEMKQIMP